MLCACVFQLPTCAWVSAPSTLRRCLPLWCRLWWNRTPCPHCSWELLSSRCPCTPASSALSSTFCSASSSSRHVSHLHSVRYYLSVCNQSCSSGQLACMAENFTWDIMHKPFNEKLSYLLCLKAPLISTVFYHFQWHWLWLGVTKSAQSKLSWLHFLHIFFKLIGMKFAESVQAEWPDNILREIY